MEKRSWIITIVVIFVIVFSIAFIYKKECDDDECFNKALAECEPTKYYGYKNNNLYLYKISRSFGKCRLYVKIEKMAIGTEPDLIRLLEDKDMKCQIPKSVVITLDEMESLLNYCHGTLKENLYQLMLERLYALVIRDMSGIIKEAEKIMRVQT